MALLVVTCPIEGTYLVHQHDQRPVEGIAVHKYIKWWACQRCGPVTDERRDCKHIILARHKERNLDGD